MPVSRILQLGDPVLREISTRVTDARTAAPILADLRDTLHEFQRTHGFGRGISAVQIGQTRRVIYMEFEGIAYSLINPEYVFVSDEKFDLWDDCFSFPDLLVRLERARRVSIRYVDTSGDAHELEAEDALSELIQHEMDHLDGILAIDRALNPHSLCTRSEWLRRFAAEAGAALRASNSQGVS